jgi:maltose alpha-D-glucosyltransferase / alpha-amylase
VCVHNLRAQPTEIRLELADATGEALVDLIDDDESTPDERGAHRLALDAFGYRWYRLGTGNSALRRRRQSG